MSGPRNGSGGASGPRGLFYQKRSQNRMICLEEIREEEEKKVIRGLGLGCLGPEKQ